MPFTDIAEQYPDATLNIALDTLNIKKQALVFCNTKRGAESQAEKIAQKVKNPDDAAALDTTAKAILDAVQSPTKQCERLAACVRKGTAFHHSGLNSKQRELVETKFRDGTIKIICATPTLAMGMDMPAYRSIIRDLKRYTSGTSWGMADIPVLEYEQMCVPGETLIKTSKGDIAIKEIVESEEQFQILTYDENHTYSYQPIVARFRRKASHLIRIELARGYVLRATANHPIYAVRDGQSQWIPAGKLLLTDKLLLTAKTALVFDLIDIALTLPQNGVYLPFGGDLIQEVKAQTGWSDREIGNLVCVEKRNMYHYKYNKKALPLMSGVLLSTQLKRESPTPSYFSAIKSRFGDQTITSELFSTDFLWLVGMIASDGTMTSSIDRRSSSRYVKIKIGNTNPKIINRARTILDRVVPGACYISKREDGFMQLEKGATLLADILSLNFGIPHGAKSRTVRAPVFLRTASNEHIGAYLCGVFDGDGSYLKGRRIHFATASQEFAHDLQMLLLQLGIISSLSYEKAGQTRVIRGKTVVFPEGIYCVKITKKSSMQKFAEFVKPVKCIIEESCSTYHNIDSFHNVDNDDALLKIKRITAESWRKPVYNIGVAVNNNYFANGILVHNCGRAGRPGKEDKGEAICIAQTESEKEKITEQYIFGEPESIYSKLAVEPVLRTYVLSLISSGYVHDTQSLYDFFDETFYAYQYEDTSRLHMILDKMIQLLAEWGFIIAPAHSEVFVSASDLEGDTLSATPLGQRVAQLYLDPYTAQHLLTSLEEGIAANMRLSEFPLLHLISTTLEMRPLLNIKQSELASIDNKLLANETGLFVKSPTIYSHEYEEFLQTVKTASCLQAWVSEAGEDVLFAEYNVRPGELQAKRDIADWLLYSLVELSKLKKWHSLIVEFEKMRMRLEYGATEEILPLLRLKGIGRIRARKLYHNGIRSIDAVKTAELSTLRALIGEAMTISIREQVGEPIAEAQKQNKRKGQINIQDFG